MSYKAITDTSSPQWYYRTHGETNDLGLREYQGHVLVAMGLPYGNVGDKLKIEFESGQELEVIIGDSKGDRCSHDDGSMIEFIVDTSVLSKDIQYHGVLESIYGGKMINIWKLSKS